MKTCPHCAEEIEDSAVICRHCGLDVSGPPAETPSVTPQQTSSGCGLSGCAIVLIVGVGVFFVLLMLPRFRGAREAARRTQCRNNLKEIGLALHSYHEVHGVFPPAYIPDENGTPMHSWRVLILPYLVPYLDEQVRYQALYERYDFSQPWDAPANQYVLDHMPRFYGCPSHPESKGNTTSYAAVAGENTVISTAGPVKTFDVTDGLGQTVLAGEIRDVVIRWTAPVDVDPGVHSTIGDPQGFSSYHAGGAMFLFGDGRVRFLTEDIPLEVLSTRDGGDELEF